METGAVCSRGEYRRSIYRFDDGGIRGLSGLAHRAEYLDTYFAGGISTRRLGYRIERPEDVVRGREQVWCALRKPGFMISRWPRRNSKFSFSTRPLLRFAWLTYFALLRI